jgi:hypothetical protein
MELKKIDGNEFSSILCLGSMVDYCWNYWFGTKGGVVLNLGGIFNRCVNNNACTNRYYCRQMD